MARESLVIYLKRNLMIRIGLGLFFLVFGVLKFTSADWFLNNAYKMFYGTVFPVALLYLVGIVQLAVAVSFFWNKHTKYAAYAECVMLAATVIVTFPKILTTFTLPPPEAPPGFLFFAAVPLFFMALSQALKG